MTRHVLTADHATGDYFEKAATVAGDPKMTANWVTTELLGAREGRRPGGIAGGRPSSWANWWR